MADEPKISKTLLKTGERYLNRMRRGERILRDSRGRLQWADGRQVSAKTVDYLLETRQVEQLDTDLFGDFPRGQTIGLV